MKILGVLRKMALASNTVSMTGGTRRVHLRCSMAESAIIHRPRTKNRMKVRITQLTCMSFAIIEPDSAGYYRSLTL